MERNMIAGSNGSAVDITKQVDQLLDICGSGDLITPHEMDFIQHLGRTVIDTAGRDALAGLIDNLAGDITPEFADFLWTIWIAGTVHCR